MVGVVFEGISSTLILFWGQFLLQNIYVHLESRQGILEFKVLRANLVLYFCALGCMVQSEGSLKTSDFPHFKFQTF